MTTVPLPHALEDHQESIAQFASRMATRFAIATGIVVTALVLVLNLGRNPIPMLEDIRSFGVIAFFAMLPISFVLAAWGFVLGVDAWNARVGPERQRKWGMAVVPVALAYMLFTAAVGAALLTLVEDAFQFLELAALQAAMAAGGVSAAFAYWVENDSIQVRTGRLLTLIVVIVAMGMYFTVTRIDDPLWWQVSFSYLGKMESNVNFIFNFTLIFAGILLLVWLQYFMSDFRILADYGIATERWVRWIRFGLIWLAIAVMLVGLFKSNYTPFSSIMHNLSAYSLAAVFGALMLSGRWTVPGFPREFHVMSWSVLAILVGTLISSAFGWVNTVGLEIIAFVLGMIWLSQFVGNTEGLSMEVAPEAFPD